MQWRSYLLLQPMQLLHHCLQQRQQLLLQLLACTTCNTCSPCTFFVASDGLRLLLVRMFQQQTRCPATDDLQASARVGKHAEGC